MKTKVVRVISVLLLVTIFINVTSQPDFAAASSPTTALEQTSTQPPSPIDPQELEVFLDGLLAAEMADKHIPGAVVAVVQDGNLLLAKGYGYADLDAQVPVDPERTLFRVGSVTKLFTWTAVMQLLEQGQLSLDTDVNEYLDFTIPATFPEPVTLRHLLSHTPGFEFNGTSFYRLQATDMVPLGDWVKDNLPARVFRPGEVASYSNYGAALAGYIVERISGQPFDEYVEHNILVPLGMARSTLRQPLPENLAPDMAMGYHYTNEYVKGSFIFQLPYPAGALSATATDMAHFMIAHLQNGELDGRRILQEETARQMHAQLYTPDPRLNGGMTHGFKENMVNGQRVIWHDGGLTQFHSNLWLIPEQKVGVFFSTTSTYGFMAVKPVMKAFLDHYYPVAEPPDPRSAAGFAERITPYLGQYTEAMSSFTTYEKIFGAFSPITTSLTSDDTLVISQPGLVQHFAEVEPGLLQEIGDPDNQWVYGPGPDGHLFLQQSEPYPKIKTPWYGTSNLHLLLFLSGTLLFLSGLIAWPIAFVWRRKKTPTAQSPPRSARLARWAAAIFGMLWLMLLLGITSIFMDILPGFGGPRIIFDNVPLLNILLSLSYILAGLALVILVFAVLAWLRRYWSLGGRIFYSLLALMALLLTWSLTYWNLFL